MSESNEPRQSADIVARELGTLRSHVTVIVTTMARIEESLKANTAAHALHESQDIREMARLEKRIDALHDQNAAQEVRIRALEQSQAKIWGGALVISAVFAIAVELLRRAGH